MANPEAHQSEDFLQLAGVTRAWWIVLLVILAAGTGLLLTGLLPYAQLKPAVDRLARDGNLEIFTPALHAQIRPLMLIVAGFLLAASIAWIILRRQSYRFVSVSLQELSAYSLREDIRAFSRPFSLVKGQGIFLLGVTVLTLGALLLRTLYLSVPMRYDEAYTVVAFAIRPLWNAISDYHLPNNHLFHTLFVHFSIRWFGINEVAARLPALLAGLLCIPVSYLVGRGLYNRWTGLLAAAWIAFSPILVIFSTNARGYSLVCLFTLILVGLANYLRQRGGLIAWSLLTMITALGFFTLPTMLYPAGTIYAWLALSWLFKDTGAKQPNWVFPISLLASGLLAGLLSLLLYTPVLLTSGLETLVANRHVVSLSWYEFSSNLPLRAVDTWKFWTTDWPAALSLVFALGLLLSIFLHARIARHKIHLLVPTVLWIALTLTVQRVAPLPRIWLFLLPLCQILAAAGIIGGMEALIGQRPIRQKNIVFGTSILLLAGVLILATLSSNPANQEELAGPVREASQISDQLLTIQEPGELIAANSPVQAPLRFYLLQRGATQEIFYNEQDPQAFTHLLLVVERGNDLDQELVRLKLTGQVDLDHRVTVAETGGLIAYRVPRLP
jgi:uncharacterized membrane protein